MHLDFEEQGRTGMVTLPASRHNERNRLSALEPSVLAFGHHGQETPHCVTWGGFAPSKGYLCLGKGGMNVGFDCSSLMKLLSRNKLPSQNRKG